MAWTSFSGRITANPQDRNHATVTVFAGPDDEHRAHTGQLVMTETEAKDLVQLFTISERRRVAYIDPPEGWYDFGTHVWVLPEGIGLELSPELGEDGLPRWERLVLDG